MRLAIGALKRVRPDEREGALEGLSAPEGPLLPYLAEEVFEQEPAAVRELIRAVAPFERFSPELCEALGLVGSGEAIDFPPAGKGCFLHHTEVTPTCSPSTASSASTRTSGSGPKPRSFAELHRRAAAWFEEKGALEDALRSYVESGDEAALARFLAERGEALLSRGFIEPVIRAGEALLPAARNPRVEEITGESHALVGDWDEALACYQRAAGDPDTLPPGLAWRMGRLYWDRGMLEEAAAVFARGRVDGSDPDQEALLLAWMTSPYWSSGDVARARELAERALDAATISGSPRALAAAHNAVGLNYLGRDNILFERHMAFALEAAEAAGDVLQIVRFTINRCGPAEPKDTIESLGAAISLAELAGAGLYLARGLNARGENYLALGCFDDAVADFRRALSLWEQHDSARRAWALMSLASVARQRGDLAYARAAYEEALEASEDAEGLINARSGLSRVLAYEEPVKAQQLAGEAVEEGRRLGYMLGQALLAAGWVALARGDREGALASAREAAAEAHRQRIRFEYAEALELEAMASPDPDPPGEPSGGIGDHLARGRKRGRVGSRRARDRVPDPRPRSGREGTAKAARRRRTRAGRRRSGHPQLPAPRRAGSGSHQDTRIVRSPPRRTAGAPRGVAVAQGAQPAQDPRGEARPSRAARLSHGRALARRGSDTPREPSLGRAESRALSARPRETVRSRPLRVGRQERSRTAVRGASD